jgi:DNA-directed RNA polymerase subunit RPC12/RpoP
MKKHIYPKIYLTLLLIILSTFTVRAQENTQLTLKLSRDFGYSGFGGDIQGTFTLKASGAENLSRVTFLIDGSTLAEVSQPPFQVQFNTGNYNLGVHTLSAVGRTASGQELQSNAIQANFVTPGEGWSAALKIIIPVLALVLAAALFSAVVPWLTSRGKTSQLPFGTPRNYGVLGAAVCPRCGRPFGRHWWGINLLAGKLDRCPNCGKWSIVRRATPAELSAAEAAELAAAKAEQGEAPALSEEERLRRELEDSRYQDL